MKIAKLLAPLAVVALLGGAVFAANTTSAAKPTSAAQSKTALVNLNTATLKQLETLPGIGPKTAQQIIKNHPYKSGIDLRAKVKLITQAEWLKIAKRVTF